ncbi:MAG: hypothetical protein ACI9W6_003092 [Motiliproteus sp.]|jgi:hypothetical protein
MGSWIIVATFVVTALYLMIEDRDFSPLPLLSKVATAMLLCFFGLLFTAATAALLVQISAPLEQPIGQALLVSLGALLGLGARHFWKRQTPSRSRPENNLINPDQ